MLQRIISRTGNQRQGGGPGDGTMARRRGIFTARLVGTLAVVFLLTLLMGGRVFISNRITDLRANIAELEDQREFLEAGQASLQAALNAATSPATIRSRAHDELGLVRRDQPGLALVRLPAGRDGGTGLWQRMMDHLGLPDGRLARITPVERLAGAMVSLTPRSAVAAEPLGAVAETSRP